ncbi:MAG: hypothetical protein AAGK74_09380 [Chloroflexota bacterium]
MLRLLIRPGLLLLAMLTVMVVGVRSIYGLVHQPESEFTHEGCSGPCWRGLDMRSATYDEVATALDVVEFPVYQRSRHRVDEHDVYLLFREQLIFLEVQGIDCPVGFFVEAGAANFATHSETLSSRQVYLYFLRGAGSYTVLWDSKIGFTLFQSRAEPIMGTQRSDPVSWAGALAAVRRDCS